MTVEYSSNNSGGKWWLTPQDWKNLEAAGWEVEWREWLGSPATEAVRHGLDLHSAVDEWERITGQSADEDGCQCCGVPHSFVEHDEHGRTVACA